jgi:hypothetical protein
MSVQVQVQQFKELERSPDEDRLLWNAEEMLVAQCMEERGFDYRPNPPGTQAVQHARVQRGDVDAALAVGYGLHQSILQGESPNQAIDANAEQLDGMTSEQQQAFHEALLFGTHRHVNRKHMPESFRCALLISFYKSRGVMPNPSRLSIDFKISCLRQALLQ